MTIFSSSRRRTRPVNSVYVEPDADVRRYAYRLPRFHKTSMKRCTKNKDDNCEEDEEDQEDEEPEASGYKLIKND